MNYIVLNLLFDPPDSEATDIAMAFLGEAGFDSFEEVPGGLNACIQASSFDEENTRRIISVLSTVSRVNFSITQVPAKNWNAEWEKSFEPVIVDNRCLVRASFHPENPAIPINILIDPKMAFGTGHHETTSMMITAMLDLPFEGKEILDMGTGTGILAILASKLGATHITAVDIDEWSCSNAMDNIQLNNAYPVMVLQGDIQSVTGKSFDIILANINRNILLIHLPDYLRMLRDGGLVLISGFLREDTGIFLNFASKSGLSISRTLDKNNWCALLFQKN